MSESVTLSATIVVYNDVDEAKKACQSLLEHTKKYPLTLYVVDNASPEGVEPLENLAGIELIRMSRNMGFGAAHNAVLEKPLGKYHFVVNPDIVIESDVLSQMADEFEQDEQLALAMPRILNEDGSEQHLPKEKPTFKRLFLGRLAPLGGVFAKIRREYVRADLPWDGITDIDFCSGCFMAVPSDNFQKLGGFDERFFMYLEDADLTLRAKALGRTVFIPHIAVTHRWQRESAKSIKYLLIHTVSCLKFLFGRRKT